MAGIAVSAQLPVGEEALSGLPDLLSHKKTIDIYGSDVTFSGRLIDLPGVRNVWRASCTERDRVVILSCPGCS
jgi:hypothetical protein